MIKIIFSTLLLTINLEAKAHYLYHQDTLPLLPILQQALFPPDEPKVPAYKYSSCTQDERELAYDGPLQVDSSVLVRTIQPDSKIVCELLLQIAQTKDYRYFDHLMVMYDRHQAYFQEEWEYIHQRNKSGCKIKRECVQIMYAFEHALYALELAANNTSQAELVALYKNHVRNFYEYIYNKPNDHSQIHAHRKEIDGRLHYYSPYFKEVRAMRGSWAAYYPGFGFYSAFLDELEDYMINQILALDATYFKKLPKENFEEYFKGQEILYHIQAMRNKGSRKFEQAIETVFDEFAESGYIVRVFEYTQANKAVSPDFIRFLLDKIYTHERFKHDLQVQQTFTGMMGYLLNTHTRPVIKEYLLERTEAKNQEDRLRTWSYLRYFTNDPEVLQLMLDKSKQKNLSMEERKVLTNNFQRMLKAPDFPEESKALVKKQYEKMKNNNKYKN